MTRPSLGARLSRFDYLASTAVCAKTTAGVFADAIAGYAMTQQASSPSHAARMLRWLTEMGADEAIGETPVDRRQSSLVDRPVAAGASAAAEAASVVPSLLSSTSPALPAHALLVAPPDQVVLAARDRARAARTLDELRQTLERFEGCALRATASRLVFGDGFAQARVMFVGEAPGREEDREGRPFVGRSGQLLDRMLASIGLDRTSAYIANVVPWRPPGNRTPTPQETATCLPFIERQIELVAPEILVLLGAPAAQALLGEKEGILRLRGRWRSREFDGRNVRVLATLHPAFLLRQPAQKKLSWRDFRMLRRGLEASLRPETS